MHNPRVLDIDPAILQREVFVPSADGKTFGIVTQQNTEPVLSENQAQRNDAPKHQFNDKSGLTKIASIPNVILIRLREAGIMADPERFKAWLNAPENKMFRTRGGKV